MNLADYARDVTLRIADSYNPVKVAVLKVSKRSEFSYRWFNVENYKHACLRARAARTTECGAKIATDFLILAG